MTIEDALEEMAREAELRRLEEEKKGIVSSLNTGVVVPEDVVDLDSLDINQKKFNESMHFNRSLEFLRNKGYNRHLRPIEAFSVLINYLENKENSKYFGLAKNMLSGDSEWMSCAFRKEKNILHVAIDPKNLVWNGDIYIIDGSNLVASEVKSFDIGSKNSDTWIDLNEFFEDLIKCLYGRRFKDLPEEMREGNKRAQLSFRENVWWPVGLGVDNDNYGINADFYYGISRGVCEKTKIYLGL